MVKVIAEIGINHKSSERVAEKLIDAAHSSGCWAVKFQYRSENFFSENQEMGSTLIIDELDKSKLDNLYLSSLEEKKLALKKKSS